jgi:hypothetical protein
MGYGGQEAQEEWGVNQRAQRDRQTVLGKLGKHGLGSFLKGMKKQDGAFFWEGSDYSKHSEGVFLSRQGSHACIEGSGMWHVRAGLACTIWKDRGLADVSQRATATCFECVLVFLKLKCAWLPRVENDTHPEF